VKQLLFIWTEILRPITEALGSAINAYPWLLAIPVTMAVVSVFAIRQELEQ